MSDEQFLTSPFLPRFHLFSHKLKFFVEEALRALLGPPGPGALAPATPSLGGPGLVFLQLLKQLKNSTLWRFRL